MGLSHLAPCYPKTLPKEAYRIRSIVRWPRGVGMVCRQRLLTPCVSCSTFETLLMLIYCIRFCLSGFSTQTLFLLTAGAPECVAEHGWWHHSDVQCSEVPELGFPELLVPVYWTMLLCISTASYHLFTNKAGSTMVPRPPESNSKYDCINV